MILLLVLYTRDVEPVLAHQGRGVMVGERVERGEGTCTRGVSHPLRAALTLRMNADHRL